MTTLKQVKQEIASDPKNWFIYLMDFVDDFRRRRDAQMIEEPFGMDDERFDALLAATAEQLCAELSRNGFSQCPPCAARGSCRVWRV